MIITKCKCQRRPTAPGHHTSPAASPEKSEQQSGGGGAQAKSTLNGSLSDSNTIFGCWTLELKLDARPPTVGARRPRLITYLWCAHRRPMYGLRTRRRLRLISLALPVKRRRRRRRAQQASHTRTPHDAIAAGQRCSSARLFSHSSVTPISAAAAERGRGVLPSPTRILAVHGDVRPK